MTSYSKLPSKSAFPENNAPLTNKEAQIDKFINAILEEGQRVSIAAGDKDKPLSQGFKESTNDNKYATIATRARELYRKNHGMYQEIAETTFADTVKRYITGFDSKLKFQSNIQKIQQVDQDFVNHFSKYSYSSENSSIINLIYSTYKHYLSGFESERTYRENVRKIKSLQETLKPDMVIVKRKAITTTTAIQQLQKYCDDMVKRENDLFFMGSSSSSSYESKNNAIKKVKEVIAHVEEHMSLFKSLDFQKSQFDFLIDGVLESDRVEKSVDTKTDNKLDKENLNSIEQQNTVEKTATISEENSTETIAGNIHFISSAYKSHMAFLQKNLNDQEKNSEIIALKAASISGQEKAHVSELERLIIINKYKAFAIEVSALALTQHSQALRTLASTAVSLFEGKIPYDTLNTEQKYNINEIYPEVFENIKKQCILDSANSKLTGLVDASLLSIIGNLQIKLSAMVEGKTLQDPKTMRALNLYLKSAR